MLSLSGKVAIVTGASNGIGRAIAERLAEDGAIVVVNYNQSDEKVKQAVTDIQAKGGKAVAVQADMSQVADACRLVIETVKQFGRLDILVNNAGRFMPKPLLETTEADFEQVIALNAKGPYFAMQEAANLLKEGGPHREHFDRWNSFEFSRCDGLSWQRRRTGTVHERTGVGTCSTGHYRQYCLARFYRDGHDDRPVPPDWLTDVAVEAAWRTQRHCRCGGVRRQ